MSTTPENQILSQEEIEEIATMPKDRVTLVLRSGKEVPLSLLAETIRELQRQLDETSNLVAAIVHQAGGKLRVTEYAQVVGPKGRALRSWTDTETRDIVFELVWKEPGPYRQLTPEDVMEELDKRAASGTKEGGDK